MARKLPWSTGGLIKKETSRPSASTPPKRQRLPSPSDTEPGKRSNLKATQTAERPETRKQRKRPSRTPSTSPPPGPPETEYMHEGYDGDDIYILVEDEFHSVAQSFTHHLHHAEYKRLQRKAREAPPRSLPRPTHDMRIETKKRVEAIILNEKQGKSLKNMNGDIMPSTPPEGELANENLNDPWLGTSLAGLMSISSRQKTALVGLEAIPSSTRAARGFGRVQNVSPQKRREPMTIMEEIRRGQQDKSKKPVVNGHSDHEEDDLEMSSAPQVTPAKDTRRHRSTTLHHQDGRDDASHTVSSAPRHGQRSLQKPKASDTGLLTPQLKLEDQTFDDGFRDVDVLEDVADSDSRRRKLPRNKYGASDVVKDRNQAQERELRKKKARLSDIPTFLV